jgi:hypothetical protein
MIAVSIDEVTAPGAGGVVVTGGLAGTVVLNPDISNPNISNPDISNPNISNPNISNSEVYNPNISNPNISNPNISNPDISNPNISNPDISNVLILNPDISNPNISNPDISNPDISNPDISNPNISNPDISNGALTDITWTITNDGNTTSTFNVDLFMQNANVPQGIKTQLILHKQYATPTSDGCDLKSQMQSVLVANIINPVFKSATTPVTKPDPGNPNISNATLWLEPGAEAMITLRVVDTQPSDGVVFNPATTITPVVTSTAYNVADLDVPTAPAPVAPPASQPPPTTQPPTTSVPMLSFATQPAGSTMGVVLPPFAVQATNLTAGTEIPVTIAVATGGSLGGTTTKMTIGGIATFADIVVSYAASNMVFVASSSPADALPAYSTSFTISKHTATVLVSNLNQTFDGTPKSVTVETIPAGLGVSVTYDGSPIAPSAAGSYAVIAVVNTATYAGTAAGTLVIAAPSALQVHIAGTAGGTENYNVGGGPAAAQGTAPVSAGLALNAGDSVTITATGGVSWYGDPNNPPEFAGPNGAASIPWQPAFIAASPTQGISLVARIGAGPWQFVGAGPTTLVASVAGDLQFAVNDSFYGDNGGEWIATISVSAGIVTLAPAGGAGGSAFGPIDCPVGSVATGLRGGYDNGSFAPLAIVSTQLWCTPISGGVLAPPAALAGLSEPPVGTPTLGVQTDYGAALTCPAGKVVTGIFGSAAANLVNTLGVQCDAPGGGSPVSVGPAGNGSWPGTTAFLMSCPAGKTAIGIEGRQGWNLDQIALRCK